MKARTLMKRLLSMLMAVVLCLGLTPVTAWAASSFPNKFYAHLMNKSGMGTVNSFLNYTSKDTEAQQVHGMEYAGGVFFTVVGNKDDDGWRELRMYNSNLTNYRTIGTVNQVNGGYWIVDTAMDLSGAEPVLYGTYNGWALIDGEIGYCSSICQISLMDGTTSNWKTVTGIPATDIIYAMAFNEGGTLYAISADRGDDGGPASLYTIDKASGAATEVGEIKDSSGEQISTNYVQDLAFDHATNTLYWAENDENVLYTLDIATAVATWQGQVKYNNKAYPIQSFCIPYDTAFGQDKDHYMISVICEGAGTVTSGGENSPFYLVSSGENITLNIAPNIITGDDLKSVTVDGESISTTGLVENGYTFSNVGENHVIQVTFKKEIPAEQNNVYWLHYQGKPASFYTVDNVYKFYDLPYLDKEVPREGYVQTLLDENNQSIDGDEIILPGNYDVHVTHPGNTDYAALDVTYEDALQLAKCPGTPGRPVVYGKVGCTQGDLATTSALQDYYGTDGNLIDAAHDDIPVTLEWLEPETVYNKAGNFYASATIYAAQNLDQRLKDCYNLDDGTTPLTDGCRISSRATQVVVLPADEASLIKVQASDASGGTVSGKGVYKNGETVTVTAAVNENAGYEFKGWQENGQTVSTNATYTFEASGDRTLTALFEINEDYRVTLKTDPQDAGTVTGGGSYEDGSHEATVEATAKPGYYFIGWYKDGQTEAVSTDAEYTFTVEEDGAALTAKFDIDYLSRAEQAKTNFDSALGTSAFEWQTLVQAVDAYKAAEKFVNDNPPSVIENAMNRFNTLTDYYNKVQTLNLPNQGIDNADLAKLYLFTGVTELNLSGNRGVTDLTGLTSLTTLTTLDISNTGVTNLGSNQSVPQNLATLTAKNLSLTSISALAELVNEEDFDPNDVTKWDFTDSTLPDTEENRADIETIQGKIIVGEFIPPTIKTTPDPTPIPTPTPAEYAVVVADCEHGKISATPEKAAEGDAVTVAATPEEGFEARSVSATGDNGEAVEVSRNDDGTFSFEMPAFDVTVSATFGCDGGAHCPSHGFADVDQSQWYHDAVDWAVANGVMGGFGNGLFGPDMELTRAQMAQILWSIEGKPAVDYLVTFGDVGEGDWHHGAVAWAASEGVFEGYGDGSGFFGPDDSLTREQAAAVLMRWAASSGEDTSARADLSSYPDAAGVSEWATECVSWAVAEGVISGVELPDGTLLLDAQGTSSRAMAAALMMRLIG